MIGPRITVNGRSYALVRLDELTLDEAIIVWEYSRLSLDQIADLDGFHPGITAALIHIAVARGEPDEPFKTIRKTVGALPMAELESVFEGISEEVDDTVPPPIAPNADEPSKGFGADSSVTGGPAPGLNGQNSSGGRGSATGAISDPATSAA